MDCGQAKKKQTVCGAKHTKYNPTLGEFRCPRCGAKAGVFVIEEQHDEEVNWDCPKLHPKDQIVCYGRNKKTGEDCGYHTTGARLAAALMKKKDLIPCPYCKQGVVPKKTASKFLKK
jgi:DNA-directed RNA polymerase subunit RPC12/RpoP